MHAKRVLHGGWLCITCRSIFKGDVVRWCSFIEMGKVLCFVKILHVKWKCCMWSENWVSSDYLFWFTKTVTKMIPSGFNLLKLKQKGFSSVPIYKITTKNINQSYPLLFFGTAQAYVPKQKTFATALKCSRFFHSGRHSNQQRVPVFFFPAIMDSPVKMRNPVTTLACCAYSSWM